MPAAARQQPPTRPQISAVEGIRLTPAMQRRAAEFERKGLSPEERIRAIVAIHRKG
jgi:hypothetical protein